MKLQLHQPLGDQWTMQICKQSTEIHDTLVLIDNRNGFERKERDILTPTVDQGHSNRLIAILARFVSFRAVFKKKKVQFCNIV